MYKMYKYLNVNYLIFTAKRNYCLPSLLFLPDGLFFPEPRKYYVLKMLYKRFVERLCFSILVKKISSNLTYMFRTLLTFLVHGMEKFSRQYDNILVHLFT